MQNKILPILLGIFLIALSLFFNNTQQPLLKYIRTQLDNEFYDYSLKFSLNSSTKKTNVPIVIVDVNDESLIVEGRWPWHREKMALLTKKLQEAGATVIAFDIIFTDKENNVAQSVLEQSQNSQVKLDQNTIQNLEKLIPIFDADTVFAKQLAASDTLLGFIFYDNEKLPSTGQLPAPLTLKDKTNNIPSFTNYRANIAKLQDAAKYGGFITIVPDPDGILRHAYLLLRYQNNVYPLLAFEAVRRYLLIDEIKVVTNKRNQSTAIESIQLGNTVINTNENGAVYIPFLGLSGTFPYISATDVLHNKFNKKLLTNALVFVGSTSALLHDLHATPFESLFPGLEIQANIANNLINGHFIYTPSWAIGAETLALVLVGLFCVLIFPFLQAFTVFILAVSLILALFFFNTWLLSFHYLSLSIFPLFLFLVLITLLNLVYGFFAQYHLRIQLKEVFGQYLPEEIVSVMSKNPKKYSFEGESKDLTTLFLDIRNFTSIAEKMNAIQVRQFLNYLFTALTEIIFKYKGTIDKYIGDSIMAFWGAPIEHSDHQKLAISAALEMIKATESLKNQMISLGVKEIHISIGINTGNVYVGDMGSKFRRSYTVLGDSVNVASRLQELTKYYRVNIIVSGIKENGHNFILRFLDKVRVRGKLKPIKIYEVIGYKKDIREIISEEFANYETALEFYYAKKWEEAENRFLNLMKEHPEVFVYQLYLSRIKELRSQPPDATWDGTYVHLDE